MYIIQTGEEIWNVYVYIYMLLKVWLALSRRSRISRFLNNFSQLKNSYTEFHENPSLFSRWYWLIDGREHMLGLRMPLFSFVKNALQRECITPACRATWPRHLIVRAAHADTAQQGLPSSVRFTLRTETIFLPCPPPPRTHICTTTSKRRARISLRFLPPLIFTNEWIKNILVWNVCNVERKRQAELLAADEPDLLQALTSCPVSGCQQFRGTHLRNGSVLWKRR